LRLTLALRHMNKFTTLFSSILLGLVFSGCSKSGEISAIEEAIRLELKKPEGKLTPEHYQGLTELSIYRVGRPVKDISLLGELTNLETLDFAGGEISDPTPLAKLTKLRHLQIHECGIKDFSALTDTTSLEELMASGNQVSDISSLKGLTNLKVLNLKDNLIKDASPLLELKSLTWVDLSGNSVSEQDIGDLKKALPKCHIEL